MIDVRTLRADFDGVRRALARRADTELLRQIDRAVALDDASRDIVARRDAVRAEINDLSKEVGQLRRNGDTAGAEGLQTRSRALGEHERVLANELEQVQGELREILLRIPNLPHPDAPDGVGEADNVLVKGPIGLPESFPEHRRVPHWDAATALGILDSERAVKISGAMFTMQRGQGAALARGLCQLALDRNADAFEEIRPPTMVSTATLVATGHLPKFADDAFAIERDGLWMIPTAEVPLTSLHAGEVIDADRLPIRVMAYTPCFRREAGSAGRDARHAALARVRQGGDPRDHRCRAGAGDARRARRPRRGHHRRTRPAVPHHRDLHRRHGPEPPPQLRHRGVRAGCDAWLEVSSISWFSDYQARRADIRHRVAGQKGTQIAHTLNGSALAVPRVWAAIVENFREADGSVTIPEVLRPYMRGAERIA